MFSAVAVQASTEQYKKPSRIHHGSSTFILSFRTNSLLFDMLLFCAAKCVSRTTSPGFSSVSRWVASWRCLLMAIFCLSQTVSVFTMHGLHLKAIACAPDNCCRPLEIQFTTDNQNSFAFSNWYLNDKVGWGRDKTERVGTTAVLFFAMSQVCMLEILYPRGHLREGTRAGGRHHAVSRQVILNLLNKSCRKRGYTRPPDGHPWIRPWLHTTGGHVT